MDTLLSRRRNLTPEKKLQIIKLSPDNKFDCQYKHPPIIIYYNKADLQAHIGDYPLEELCIIDLFKLLDAGEVAIYSETDEKMVSEIKKEVFDNALERRIRYYLPDGTQFIDVKTMAKTPNFSDISTN